MTSLVVQTVKASAYKAGDPGLIPGLGRSPQEGNGMPGKSHGQRSLVGYSAWGRKESDRLSDFTFTFCFLEICLSIYFLTLQYCIGLVIYQDESATGIHMFPILNPHFYMM